MDTGDIGDCKHSPDGRCERHGQAQKLWRPKKRWAKGKSGLFGWKYAREHYWKCVPPRPGGAGITSPASSTFLILSSSAVSMRGKHFKKPSKVGQKQ